MGVVTPCDTIFRITLPTPGSNAELADIAVKAQLAASTAYWYIVTDKFGNQYVKEVNTDGNGAFTLAVADFPAGLFNPYAGSFQLQVKQTLQDAVPQQLKFCNVTYDTIQMDFADMAGVSSSVIDCK